VINVEVDIMESMNDKIIERKINVLILSIIHSKQSEGARLDVRLDAFTVLRPFLVASRRLDALALQSHGIRALVAYADLSFTSAQAHGLGGTWARPDVRAPGKRAQRIATESQAGHQH